MRIVFFIGVFILTVADTVLVGAPCTSDTLCNYDGPDSMFHTKCDSDTCQCTSLYYGEINDAQCIRGQLGDDCSNKTDPSAFCLTVCLNAICQNVTDGQSVCACPSIHYQAQNFYGLAFCKKIEIGSPCNASGDGDNFCRYGITNSECNADSSTCQCPKDEVFVPSDQLCWPYVYTADCVTCRDTVGKCYDIEADGTPTGCACPSTRNSSGGDAAGTLTVGCDVGLVSLGRQCDSDGVLSYCVGDHTSCIHGGGLDARYKCTCEKGYICIPWDPYHRENVCYRIISKQTDQNCQWCEARGGHCYDMDEDGNRDGCVCPISRTKSDPDDPTKDCDIIHAEVQCAASKLAVCYQPHDTSQYSNIANRLVTGNALLYIENFKGKDPCVFQYTNETGRDDWCLTLELNFDSTAESPCGTSMGYPKFSVVTFHNAMVLQLDPARRSKEDLFFSLYCQYDTVIHSFTMSGADVKDVSNYASEGKEIHPTLKMWVYDSFRRDVTRVGIRIGQPVMLEIVMTDTKDVYSSIRAEVCIASNRPELTFDTSTILLIRDSCPMSDSFLSNFKRDPSLVKIYSGFFDLFKFDGNDFVFFHCAVKVCRHASECAPVNCSAAGRRKRAIEVKIEDTVDVSRAVREIRGTENELESLQSGPIRVLSSDAEHDEQPGPKVDIVDVPFSDQVSYRPILLAALIGGVVLMLGILAAAIICRMSKSKPRKNRMKLRDVSQSDSVFSSNNT